MAYTLWAVLNFSTGAFLLYLMYRVTRFAYAKFGLPGALLAVFIFLSITTVSNSRDKIEKQDLGF